MKKITQKQFKQEVNGKYLKRLNTNNNLTYQNIIQLIKDIKKEKIGKNDKLTNTGKVEFTNPQRMIRTININDKFIKSPFCMKNYKIYKHNEYYLAVQKYFLDNEQTYKYWYILYQMTCE